MEPETPTPEVRKRFVMIGKLKTTKGKRCAAFLEILIGDVDRGQVRGALGPADEARLFNKAPGRVGSVYDITVEGASYFSSGEKGPRYVGRFADAVKVAEWEAADRARDVAETLAAREAADKKISDLDTILEPVVKAMRATNSQGRAAIVADVVARLWRKAGWF